MVDELLEKDVVRPEQENPVSLPVPTERVLKVREGCQGPRIGGRRIEQDCMFQKSQWGFRCQGPRRDFSRQEICARAQKKDWRRLRCVGRSIRISGSLAIRYKVRGDRA